MSTKSRQIFLSLCVVFFFSLFHLNAQEKVWTKQDTCLLYLEQYSHYWKKDKLGKNGARELMVKLFLNVCKFTGKRWTEISKLLGEANVTSIKKNKRIYLFRVNYQSADIKEAGTMLLHIEVDNTGTIASFSIATNE
jgi:hypothetical protein